jgi:hypothetical protein
MCFCLCLQFQGFTIFKLATDPISIENSLSADIRQVTNFRGLKFDQWRKLEIETLGQNQPLTENIFGKPLNIIKAKQGRLAKPNKDVYG